MANNHYWVKFYFKDWMSNLNLQRCDVAARGLWMDLFCLMQISDHIGYLISKGNILTTTDIAKLVGLSKRRTERLLQDLLNNGICAYDENNILYSPLLVDEPISNLHIECIQNDIKKNVKCIQNEDQKCERVGIYQSNIVQKSQNLKIQKKEKENLKNNLTMNEYPLQEHVLPIAWQPSSEEKKYAQELGLTVSKVTKEFCDYWHSKTGKTALKSDWQAAWYRWCLQAKKWQKDKPLKSHPLDGFVDEHKLQWGDLL